MEEKRKTIGIRKVVSRLDGEHPNGIDVGYEREGPWLGQVPVVGLPFYVVGYNGRMLRTSPVEAVESPTRFRTRNSVYEWSVYEKEA